MARILISNIAEWVLWIALIYSIVFVVFLVTSTVRDDGRERQFSVFEPWLECLLRNGGDGEIILIRHNRTGRFVRFANYRDASGGCGIALTFPEIKWGQDYIARLRAYCADRGVSFRASADNITGERGFARIEFGDDLEGAWSLSKTIWYGFYGYGEHDRHTRIIGDNLTLSELTAPPGPGPDRAEAIAPTSVF